MKRLLFLIISSMFLISASQEYNNETKKELDTNVIVTLKEYEDISKKEVRNYFYSYLVNEIGYNYRKIDTFSNISNIVTIKINSSDISTIKNIPLVDSCYKEIEYTLNDYSSSDPNYNYLVSNEVPSNYSSLDMNVDSSYKGENTLVAVLDTSLYIDHDSFKEINNNDIRYSKNDVEDIFSKNNFNASSYNYVNNKVIYAYDYVSNDTNVISKQTHGSHVSSIITSNGRYKGIAPSSQLAFFKVFNNYGGGCTTSIYLKALEDAYLLDVDAINMSFGNVLDYDEDITDYAVYNCINKLNNEGINVFVASGNDGKNYYNNSVYKFNSLSNYETTSGSNLSTCYNTNSIGSYSSKSDLDNIYFTDGINSYEINDRNISKVSLDSDYQISSQILSKEYRFNDFLNQSIEFIKIPNKGKEEDYLNIDLSNKIALVERGEIPFYEKIDNALKNNAKGLIIYSTSSDTSQLPFFSYKLQDSDLNKGYPTLTINGEKYYDYTKINIPVGIISYVDAKTLLENGNNKITFYKEKISSFSSQGGDPYLNIGLDLLGPGDNIYGAYVYGNYYSESKKNYSDSTYLSNAYAYMSGTSMATPNVVGAYLSYLSSVDSLKESRKEARIYSLNKIKSNTTLLKDENNNSYYSPRYQGNGLVNISKSLKSNSYLTYNNKSKIELKNNDDIKNGILNFNINFNSLNNLSKNYEIKVTIEANKIIEHKAFNSKVNSNENIILETYSFKENLKNGDSISIYKELNETSKEYLSQFENGTYLEGYVELISEDESLSIPFLGYYGINYELIKPYEDFDFEKKDNSNITYESDIMNKYVSTSLNKDINDIYTGSRILMGEDTNNGFEDYFTYYKRNIATFDMSFSSKINNYYDPKIIINPISNKYSIYIENTSKTRGLTIQLYMLKSIKEGRIYIDNKLQEDSLIQNFVDIHNYGNTNELYRSYPINSSSFNSSYVYHHTIGYIAYNPKLDKTSIYSTGLHKLEFVFYTYNNTKLVYEYELYINETYVSKIEIYDITLKNNLFTIYVSDYSSKIKSLLVNDKEEISSLISLNNNKYSYSLNINELKEDTYIEFINDSDLKVSLKLFINLDILYLYGNNVSKDTSISKEEITTLDNNYLETIYYINNLNNENNINLNLGLINVNENKDNFYEYSLNDSNLISLNKNNDLYSLKLNSNKLFKYSKLDNNKEDNKLDLSTLLVTILIIVISILIILGIIGIIIYFKNKK